MALLKCKMCGGDLEVIGNQNIVECDYCGTRQTVPTVDNEKKLNLYNRANRLRINDQFDKAATLYESIIAEFPEEAEAYWGLCLCNYGIEYIDDPATGKKIPTCHRASFDSLLKDENFNLALEYSDVVVRKLYIDQAKEIDSIMSGILAVSRNEKPYDVFICYKETDEYGQRTVDSVLAQDIYDNLTAKGLKVFFARITLEDKLGREYEPYIFAALNSAKVMLCVGTKYEHFHAVWVENEWSRFLRLTAKDRSKVLIPCYKDIPPEDMPAQFRALQAQDMGKIGFMQDLVRGVLKITGAAPSVSQMPAPVPQMQYGGAVNGRPPVKIKYIQSFAAEHSRDFFPEREMSSRVDISRFPAISFNLFIEMLGFEAEADVRMIIRDGGGNIIHDSTSKAKLTAKTDDLARVWMLRGESSGVGVGNYTAVFTVNGGNAMEYRFSVINTAAAPQMPAPVPQTQYGAVPQYPPQYQQAPGQVYVVGKPPVNITVYLILCFLFGSFGIHSFYARKKGKGVIQLLLCATGISTFWAAIDFLRALITRKIK